MQLADLQLPPVIMLHESDLDVVYNPSRLSNPLMIAVRPPASIVKKCLEMLRDASTNVADSCVLDDDDDTGEENDIAIQVGGLGVFSGRSLNIWNSASQVTLINHAIKKDSQWLKDGIGILSKERCLEIENILLDSKPSDQLIALGDIIIDVSDLSTLVEERYLTGFVIDVVCLEYKEQSTHGIQTLYLPSLLQSWSSSTDSEYVKSKITNYANPKHIAEIHWVVTPMHVSRAHWGLLCPNLKSHQIYYDDGLHWNPPRNVLVIVAKILQALHELSGQQGQFDKSQWDLSLPLQRFGMPSQPRGSGSCGMGVILSVQSILDGPAMTLPAFLWKFKDMRKHRLLLMNDIVNWSMNCNSS